MDSLQLSKELLDFISLSPSMFHSVNTISDILRTEGYIYLSENRPWNLEMGKKYFTTRNNSSIIAFRLPEYLENYHFQITAAHSDSPAFKIKTIPELTGPGEYLKLNVEAYGGMIDFTWMDRPLTIAGRVLVKTAQGLKSRLLYIDKDILLIPNLAIHFNRDVNKGYGFDRQVDLLPLYSNGSLKTGSFDKMIADTLGIKPEEIAGKDLFLVNREKGTVWGWKDEFISSPKLDDLQCSFVSLKGLIDAKDVQSVAVFSCFDNEEVGSTTKQGAMSTFLKDTLFRINMALGLTQEQYLQALAGSFMVSCDNAHAVHPNHPEKTDDQNCSFMNKGIVIKESANQKYTTDAFSRAVFTELCDRAGVPVQTFANRSNMVGGSTLGNLSNTQVSIHAVDIGLPQLAMHSSYETAGSMDTLYAYKALKLYFETDILIQDSFSAVFR